MRHRSGVRVSAVVPAFGIGLMATPGRRPAVLAAAHGSLAHT
ncbi:hypothetical protein [Streptomyces siamensis]